MRVQNKLGVIEEMTQEEVNAKRERGMKLRILKNIVKETTEEVKEEVTPRSGKRGADKKDSNKKV